MFDLDNKNPFWTSYIEIHHTYRTSIHHTLIPALAVVYSTQMDLKYDQWFNDMYKSYV